MAARLFSVLPVAILWLFNTHLLVAETNTKNKETSLMYGVRCFFVPLHHQPITILTQ